MKYGLSSDELPVCDPAESSLLGSILIDGGLLSRVNGLQPEDFGSESHRTTFAAIRGLADRGEAIDLVTVQSELEKTGQLERAGGTAVLSALVDRVPDVENVKAYEGIVRDASRRRRLMFDLVKQRAALAAGARVEDVVATMARSFETLVPAKGTESGDGQRLLDPVGILRAEIYTGERCPTRIQPLDDLLGGGLAPGFAFAVAGAPGEGKTLLFVQLAAELLLQDAVVVILAGDEDRSGIAQRLGQYLGLEKDELNSAHPETLAALEEKLHGRVIRIFPDPDHPPMTVEDVESVLVGLSAKNPEALLVLLVDSLQTVKCAASHPDDAETAAVTKVVEALRGVKKRTDALILATSEAPRSSYASKDPGMRTRSIASFAGSRTPEFRFDILAFIGTSGEGPDERARLEITKNRLGHKKGAMTLRLDRERARWLPEDAAVVSAQREEQEVRHRHERAQKVIVDRRATVKALVLESKDPAAGRSLASIKEVWGRRGSELVSTLGAMVEEGLLEEILVPSPRGGPKSKFYRLAGGGAR